LINSKTKPNDAIPDIDDIIKQTPYFPGFVLCHVLVMCYLMMARCTVESMICGYYEYISKLSLESEPDLLNTAILILLP